MAVNLLMTMFLRFKYILEKDLFVELQKLNFISIYAIKIRTFVYEEFEDYATHRRIK